MRTKTLLLAAATLAASLGISSAQSVYSQNVVGYINQVIPPGFSMIANQVDYDGTGTNNTLAHIFPSAPNGTYVYKFTGSGYSTYVYGGGWLPDANLTLNPGEGAFINNLSGSPITNTFVGTVLQGTFTNTVPAGFSIKGYTAPISGGISTVLKYSATTGDYLYTWTGSNYSTSVYAGSSWLPSEPTLNIGQSFFISHAGATPTNWVINFNVSTN
jgi:hypothetical protein